MVFAWDEWNSDHIGEHRVSPIEAEFVVETAKPPWPQRKSDDKLVIWGPTGTGRLLQVIFVIKAPAEVEFDSLPTDVWADLRDEDRIVYVIHAMELSPAMKRLYRKRRRPQ